MRRVVFLQLHVFEQEQGTEDMTEGVPLAKQGLGTAGQGIRAGTAHIVMGWAGVKDGNQVTCHDIQPPSSPPPCLALRPRRTLGATAASTLHFVNVFFFCYGSEFPTRFGFRFRSSESLLLGRLVSRFSFFCSCSLSLLFQFLFIFT